MKGKYTTKINGYLIDVTEEYHKKYRPEESRHTYLKKQEKNVEIYCCDACLSTKMADTIVFCPHF